MGFRVSWFDQKVFLHSLSAIGLFAKSFAQFEGCCFDLCFQLPCFHGLFDQLRCGQQVSRGGHFCCRFTFADLKFTKKIIKNRVDSLGYLAELCMQDKSMKCSLIWLSVEALEGGIELFDHHPTAMVLLQAEVVSKLKTLGLYTAVQCLCVTTDSAQRVSLICNLRPALQASWMPDHDTLALHEKLDQSTRLDAIDANANADNGNGNELAALEREIWVALLGSPQRFRFASLTSLYSHIRVRCNTVVAARKTALAFKTDAAERPEDDWYYNDEHGFILHPGRPLIQALIAATQPDSTGHLYDFSCYRATEYVSLLSIAQEARTHHPDLLSQLQILNERHAIRSNQFHEVFLTEYGSMQDPLPTRFYVPGDRLWFRNPDECSSDVTGYEGSWVVYMGGGLFSNFWQRDAPYTLESKAIEIFHWRDGVYANAQGELRIDELLVAQRAADTSADPQAKSHVLQMMLCWRDPKGVYAQGGCIDTTREFSKSVSPDHCELVLPQF